VHIGEELQGLLLGMSLEWETRNVYRISVGEPVRNWPLEDRGDGRMTLSCSLRRYVTTVGGGVVCSVGLWYQ